MIKKSFILPIAGLLTIGLSGCGNNGEAVGEADPNNDLTTQINYYNDQNRNKGNNGPEILGYDINTDDGNIRNNQNNRNYKGYNDSRGLRVGYYSNENHHNGNARILDDNDGPLTEIMDHTFGNEVGNDRSRNNRILQNRDENGNPGNPTKPLAERDRNFLQRDNRFSTSDVNYHGHLDNKQNSQIRSANDTVYDMKLADKLSNAAASVTNVEEAHSIVYKNSVIIAVNVKDSSKEMETRQQVTKAVQPYVNGKAVNVVADEGTFTRIRDIDYRMRNNDLRDGLDMNMREIFDGVNDRNR